MADDGKGSPGCSFGFYGSRVPSPSFIAWLFQRPLLPSDCGFQWLLIMSSPSILACSMAHQLRSCPPACEGILSATDIVTHSHSRHAVAFAGAVVPRAIAHLVYNYPGHSYAHRCLPFHLHATSRATRTIHSFEVCRHL